jgi:hypothetical protein
MNKLWGEKKISIGLIILLVICIIYAANSNNQTALVIPAFILALYMMLETIWTIKDREYKTTYWIALSNIINIFCIILSVLLVTRDKDFTDIEQIAKYISIQNVFIFGFYLSLFTSRFLRLNIYKIKKGLEGHESRDV